MKGLSESGSKLFATGAEYKRHCFEPKAKLRQDRALQCAEHAAKLALADLVLAQKACGLPASYPFTPQLSDAGCGSLSDGDEEVEGR